MSLDYAALLSPLSDDAPCGIDLDEIGGLSLFYGMQVFGQQLRPLGETVPPLDPQQLGSKSAVPQYRWRQVLDEAEKTLRVSKDFRVLAHASAALIRVDGLDAFARSLEVAAKWLDIFWDSSYPRADANPEERSNALFALADKMAILDAVRRAPLVVHKQLGACTFRDIERLGTSENPDVAAGPHAILTSASQEDLLQIGSVIERASIAARSIESTMRERTGNAAVPNLSGLLDLLGMIKTRLSKFIDTSVAITAASPSSVDIPSAGTAGSSVGAAALVSVGGIRSRQDAIRALDAVAEFFRKNEPSSPVPLFVERSKRLITMGFMELLADVAPNAVEQVKSAAGLSGSSK